MFFCCVGSPIFCIFHMQLSMLAHAVEADPDTWWWIKGDRVDVVRGIGESVRGEWLGDIYLNDGSLDLL